MHKVSSYGAKARLASIVLSAWLALGLLVGGQTADAGEDSGWIVLFDASRGLENWTRIGDANWRSADGVLQADESLSGRGGYLVSKDAYRDFELRVEFWADEHANSGVFIRCVNPQEIAPFTCYEVNIFDRRPDPSYGTGAVVDFAKVSPMPRAAGRWNTFEITARGNRLSVKMNGKQTVDIEADRFAQGRIGLQYGGGVIKFRKGAIRAI